MDTKQGHLHHLLLRLLLLLLLVVVVVAGATRSGAPTEEVLLSWKPTAAPAPVSSNLSLTPCSPSSSDQQQGQQRESNNSSSRLCLLYWWMGFNTANIEERGSEGTSFTQDPFVSTLPPPPASPTSSVGTLDHVKHLAFTAPVPVPVGTTGRKLTFSLRMSAQATIPRTLPYNVANPEDDMRLASCSLNFVDFETMMAADTFLTNTGIWIIYERLPFARTDTYDYAAFTYIRRVGSRVTNTQVHELKIKYNSIKNELEWWIDGKLKHKVDRLGTKPSGMRALLDLGGAEEVITPRSFSLGFGCFSLLDAADPNAPSSSPLATTGLLNLNPTMSTGSPREVYTIPRAWQVDTRRNASAAGDASLRLFGQGASMTISAMKVSYEV